SPRCARSSPMTSVSAGRWVRSTVPTMASRPCGGLAQMTTDIVVRKVFADGPDVLTWFELHTTAAPPCPVANWSHVDGGKIDRIRATFDPRPLLGGETSGLGG